MESLCHSCLSNEIVVSNEIIWSVRPVPERQGTSLTLTLNYDGHHRTIIPEKVLSDASEVSIVFLNGRLVNDKVAVVRL